MFKLWSNPRPPDGRDEAKGREIDGERLRMLAEHFPIGKKIRYFPNSSATSSSTPSSSPGG
ncbi:MAG: hypothetical protein M5R42_14040 [Rhodocyclaceae bacterium]|nr:hypothetical protein [Rhodocyclaceae bacterium]